MRRPDNRHIRHENRQWYPQQSTAYRVERVGGTDTRRISRTTRCAVPIVPQLLGPLVDAVPRMISHEDSPTHEEAVGGGGGTAPIIRWGVPTKGRMSEGRHKCLQPTTCTSTSDSGRNLMRRSSQQQQLFPLFLHSPRLLIPLSTSFTSLPLTLVFMPLLEGPNPQNSPVVITVRVRLCTLTHSGSARLFWLWKPDTCAQFKWSGAMGGRLQPDLMRLQPDLMRHPPPLYVKTWGGGARGAVWGGSAGGCGWGGWGRLEGVWGGFGRWGAGWFPGWGGLHPTHYYHMHTSKGGDVCLGRVWGSCRWLL